MRRSSEGIVSALSFFLVGCFSELSDCPRDLADFETFTMQVSGCMGEGEIMQAIIERTAGGSYVARFALGGEPWLPLSPGDEDCGDFAGQNVCEPLEPSVTLTEPERVQLRDLFDSVRCDTRHPLSACLLGQDKNQTCVHAIFGWDDRYAQDWTCHAGGQFTILLEDSQKIREFMQGLID